MPRSRSCILMFDMEVAEKQGRRDLHQIWKILGEFMDKRLEANCEDIESGAPWATLPFGRPMIESIIQHYATIGDFQTLAMIVCMFPVPLPSPVVEKPQHHLQIPQLQRSSSTMKMGTSPSNSILSRSPPERPFLTIDTDVPNGWNSSRRRADSHNEYIERSSIQQADSEQAELQKHLSAISILNPKHHFLYNFYKTTYADLLYRWRMLNEREILMKTMTPDDDYTSNAIAIRCNTCHAETNKSWCHTCSPNNKPALQCALCRSSVRGPATLCINCRHGGHLQHFRSWFETENECPTGCGCPCLEFNAVE
ncbi:hypothetical protein EB796_019040 [Bugula neritina]|uniref:WDR59/RTC1-like RING zinc finger domain-containing protein n=1 Tax=Bugula neritina TaxID=10212 RepID=A0A7J7J9E6_BUGNE|nr:hypothetical protein EB796_019040 [Bugula neritina]